MRIFLTGVNGFAGSHLVDELLAEGHLIFGLVHHASGHQPTPSHKNFKKIIGDIVNLKSVNQAIQQAEPELIYHLAGQASPGRAWQDPASTIIINTAGTANILNSAVAYGRPKVVVVTSSELYGSISSDALPVTEDLAANPTSPYGISKLAASLLVKAYHLRFELPAIEARPFNHIGPRQSLGFVVPDFASQVAAIKLGRQKPVLDVGNLMVERDFTDVRDVVRAYHLLGMNGTPGETYLVCSGKAISIKSLLDQLLILAEVNVSIRNDPERVRSVNSPKIVGSFRKLEKHTGWRPEIELKRSLTEVLNEWIARLSSEQEAR